MYTDPFIVLRTYVVLSLNLPGKTYKENSYLQSIIILGNNLNRNILSIITQYYFHYKNVNECHLFTIISCCLADGEYWAWEQFYFWREFVFSTCFFFLWSRIAYVWRGGRPLPMVCPVRCRHCLSRAYNASAKWRQSHMKGRKYMKNCVRAVCVNFNRLDRLAIIPHKWMYLVLLSSISMWTQ